MRALILGASGFLGSNLSYFLSEQGWTVRGQSRSETPFLANGIAVSSPEDIETVIIEGDWDVVINAIAVASHEQCENDPQTAQYINAQLPARWAGATARIGARFVHISTDAVFEGCAHPPFGEEDEICPLGAYAHTKAAGEVAVLDANGDAIVTRTNFFGWSPHGSQGILDFFVRSLEKGISVTGFQDYVVSSMYVGDVAEYLVKLVGSPESGLVHLVASNALSKYAFGTQVAQAFGLDSSLIRAGSVDDSGLTRGKDLSLRTQRISQIVGHEMPTTESGLERALSDRDRLTAYFSQGETT